VLVMEMLLGRECSALDTKLRTRPCDVAGYGQPGTKPLVASAATSRFTGGLVQNLRQSAVTTTVPVMSLGWNVQTYG
jgi:hypothetical protein